MHMMTLQRLTGADLHFVAATLLAEMDASRLVERWRREPHLLEGLLEDERLFRRITGEDEALVQVSPWLLFGILLRRARRDLHTQSYTLEHAGGGRVAVFDAGRAAELLEDRGILDYLIVMLASFTRTESWSLEVDEGGRLRRRRFSDMSPDDMIALASLMPESLRFPILRRIADIALFVTGIFPDHADAWSRFRSRRGTAARTGRTLEEYEEEGSRFYRLAAQHEVARRTGLDRALDALADTFPLARKPLNVLASNYIHTTRRFVFGTL